MSLDPFLAWAGNIPPELCDYIWDVGDLNPTLNHVELQRILCECRDSVPPSAAEDTAWALAKKGFIAALRERFHTVNIPLEPDEGLGYDKGPVMAWSKDAELRHLLEFAGPNAEIAEALAREIRHRCSENWEDEAHDKILGYLAYLDSWLADETRQAIHCCRPTPLSVDENGEIATSAALNPDTTFLEISYYKRGVMVTTHLIIPVPFIVRRFRDPNGGDWFAWRREHTIGNRLVDSETIRSPRRDLVEWIKTTYRPTMPMLHALSLWLEKLPIEGHISTRLELKGPLNDAEVPVGFWVPISFGRRLDNRSDAVGILSSWYRPRTKDVATRRWNRLQKFVTTEKHRMILAYIAGSPIARKLAPNNPLPTLSLVGESSTGKTDFSRAALAVLWGVSDGPSEYIGGDAIHSGFRRADYFSATDLPILIDEASLTRQEREQMRAIANGSVNSRGGVDLLHKTYQGRAPSIWTSNSIPDYSESSSSEQHGDTRRMIQVEMDSTDIDAILANREEFRAFLARLPDDPVIEADDRSEDGGGYALHRLNELFAEDNSLESLRSIVSASVDDRQLVLDLGAAVLGMDRVIYSSARTDQSAHAFLDWLRAEAVSWVETYQDDRAKTKDNIRSRIQVLDSAGRPARAVSEIDTVCVSNLELAEYKAFRRRQGLSSPYNTITDLSSLAPITGQKPSEIIQRSGPNRAGYFTRLSGVAAKVARVKVNFLKLTPEVVTTIEESAGEYPYPDQ